MGVELGLCLAFLFKKRCHCSLCKVFSCLALQIKKLDDTEFRNAFSRAYIRVCHNVLDVPNSGFLDSFFLYFSICFV